jgi:hypothetical protein
MRDLRVGITLASLAAALSLAACSDSLALKDDLEAKVEYAAATYTVTLVSGNGTYGAVTAAERTVHNDEAIPLIATPVSNAGGLFSGWTVTSGAATIVDPYSPSTTARVVGTDATIQASFTAPMTRTWSAIASSSSGQYLAAAVNLYMVTSAEIGSIYTSSDYGATWTLQRNSPADMTWTSIASDSTGRYLAAAASQGGTIYTSSDFGVNWTMRSSGLPVISAQSGIPGANWSSIASDGTGRRLIASVSGGSIYRSADFGATWAAYSSSVLPADADWQKVSSSADGSRVTASLSDGAAYYLTDGDADWAQMQLPFTGGFIVLATQNAAGTRFVLAISGTAATGGAASNNMTSGNKWLWSSCHTALGYTTWRAAACDASGLYFIGAVNGGAIYTSDNYCGSAFAEHNGSSGLPLNAGWSCVCSDSSGARLAAGAGGGHIYVSSDRGATWSLAL